MNKLFGALTTGSDLLTAVVRQSQPLRQFGEAEKQALETITHLGEALDATLYQEGGLLNEQALQVFFANPLPDESLAAALKSQVDAEEAQFVDEPNLSPKMKKDRIKEMLSETIAQAEAKSKARQKSAKKSSQNIDSTQTIAPKLRALQKSQTQSESGAVAQRETETSEFADRKKKIVIKQQSINKSDALPVKKLADKMEPKKAINRQQAAQILEQKWSSQAQAWHSPVRSVSKSAQVETSSDQALQKPSKAAQTPVLTMETRLEQKVTEILAQRTNTGKQTDFPDTAPGTEFKAQKASDPRHETAKPQAFAESGIGHKEVLAFTPAPSSISKPEPLVGLRGLAARAMSEDAVDSTVGGVQNAIKGNHTAKLPALQNGEREAGNSTRAMSVSELTEVIAQEARRAGINLEQFEP